MVQIKKFDEALSSIRIVGSDDMIKNGFSNGFLKTLMERGVTTYGVRYGSSSISVFVKNNDSDKAKAIANQCASSFHYNDGVSVKKNLGMLRVDFAGQPYPVPMTLGPITFALYDTGIDVLEVVSGEMENLVFVDYPNLKKAEGILGNIYLR